jgi:flagellar FliL protein
MWTIIISYLKNKFMACRLNALVLLVVIGMVCLSTGVVAEDEPPGDVGYFALKPSLVSNLTGGPKYIRCDVQLMTRQSSALPQLELHTPAVRHTLLMLLAGQDGKALKTADGKEALRGAALKAVQQQLEALTGETIVDDLYFTAYYVK